MADRVITPSGQRHYIEPFDQRVFQFDTDKSDVFLSRVANSIYQVFGDNIVMYGLDAINLVYTTSSISLEISAGAAIQDQTLLVTPNVVQLELSGISSMDEAGRLVVMSNYNYLETFEQNKHSFNINYIDTLGNPFFDFMPQRDLIVLAILSFTKDTSDNVTGVELATEPAININGNQYYVKGFSGSNKRLTAYLVHQLLSGAVSGGSVNSINLDPVTGLQLVNDVENPGNLKFYGTNQTGLKGWFDISSLGTDNESSVLEYQSGFNQVLYNGNLFFVAEGHSINYELFPFWQMFSSDQAWSSDTPEITWYGDSWGNHSLSYGGVIKFLVKAGSIWANQYKPIKFKVGQFSRFDTGLPPAQVDRITVFDTSNNIIGEEIGPFYVYDTEILLNFSSDANIGSFEIQPSSNDVYDIRDFQFFGGTPGGIV
jgi:hypothetical protein